MGPLFGDIFDLDGDGHAGGRYPGYDDAGRHHRRRKKRKRDPWGNVGDDEDGKDDWQKEKEGCP